MDTLSSADLTPMQLVENMFKVEMDFLNSKSKHTSLLETGFHSNVVVHEPTSLPYAGDWKGLDGVSKLLTKMSETFSRVNVDGLICVSAGELIMLTCTLHLKSRSSGKEIRQPFAEILRFENNRLIEGTPFYFDSTEIASIL